MLEKALPFWAVAGRDRAGFGFVEHLNLSARPADVPYKRVRVQARQIYVFSHADILGYPGARDAARDGYEFLVRHARGADGSWARVLGPRGGVLDPTADLYDIAFVLFALAWYARATGSTEAIDHACRTVDWMQRAMASPFGGFDNTRPVSPAPRQQNPHMHLLEAVLALYVTTGDIKFLNVADPLVELFRRRFFDPKTGSLGEFFSGEWLPLEGPEGSRVEPGHHYEWVWLLSQYERLSDQTVAPEKSTLYAFANRWGRRPDTGLVVDAVDRAGAIVDGSVRLWPQTEAIKAHLVMLEEGAEPTLNEFASAALEQTIGNLHRYFFAREPAGTWTEHLSVNGEPIGDRIPSSSLYHIFVAFGELERVLGNAAVGDV